MPEIPVFETERLILRGVTEADAPTYERHFLDYEVIRYLSDRVPWPYPSNGVRDFLQTAILPRQGKDRWFWVITPKSDPIEIIGNVDLWRECIPSNRGFWLARKYWGHGLMTEATAPVTDYAFNNLGFEKLILNNALGNVRSRRIKEKTGARFVGVQPGKHVDPDLNEQEIWELTKENWRNYHAKSDAR